MRTRWTVRVALAAALSVAGAAPASATVVQELTLEDMVADADAVVLARVERVVERAALTPRGMEPQRLATLRVERWLKGRGAERIVVRETGGSLGDGGGMRIAGTPTYRVGQEVLVFLSRHPEHARSWRTYAMAQGFFLVRRGVGGAPDVVVRSLRDLGLARWSQGRFEVVRREGVETARLDEVLARIRRVVGWLTTPAGGTDGEVAR